MRRALVLIVLSLSAFSASADEIQVAITIDDLPFHASLPEGTTRVGVAETMLKAFKKHRISGVYGMMVSKLVEDEEFRAEGMNVLRLWRSRGHLLANHTFSHPDLYSTELPTYLEGISKNEALLRELMGAKDFHYFRFPFLAEGETKKKRDGVREFLAKGKYRIAEVTIDWFDWQWNDPFIRCTKKHDQAALEWLRKTYIASALDALEVARLLSEAELGRQIKHIVLGHIGPFQAQMMDELLTAYEAKGVRFIALPDAVADPAYAQDPGYLSHYADTFLMQIARARSLTLPKRAEEILNDLPKLKSKLRSTCQ
jgi:peptidoglycan/xylan/chitin deacetylase (PgdA/CDA1 family)